MSDQLVILITVVVSDPGAAQHKEELQLAGSELRLVPLGGWVAAAVARGIEEVGGAEVD